MLMPLRPLPLIVDDGLRYYAIVIIASACHWYVFMSLFHYAAAIRHYADIYIDITLLRLHCLISSLPAAFRHYMLAFSPRLLSSRHYAMPLYAFFLFDVVISPYAAFSLACRRR